MGAALAAKELGTERRTILFVGDGSFQLTAQELSAMIRSQLKVVIFLIENRGFTIERYIHGEKAKYNDVACWDYPALPKTFGAAQSEVSTPVVRTRTELEALLDDAEFADFRGVRFVTLFMPSSDAPRALKKTAKASAELNAKQ